MLDWKSRRGDVKFTSTYRVVDKVLVGHSKAFDPTVKLSAFKSRFYEQCKSAHANHPLYRMKPTEGQRS